MKYTYAPDPNTPRPVPIKGGVIAAAEAEYQAAAAALQPYLDELRQVSDARSAVRQRQAELAEVETIESAREASEVDLQHQLLDGQAKRLNKALEPGGTLYQLVIDRDQANARRNGAAMEVQNARRRLQELAAEAGPLLLQLHRNTGDAEDLALIITARP